MDSFAAVRADDLVLYSRHHGKPPTATMITSDEVEIFKQKDYIVYRIKPQ